MTQHDEKYVWTYSDIEEYYKKQAQELSKKLGMKIPPKSAMKIIHDNIIVPNNIHITELIVLKNKRVPKKKMRLYL